MNTISHILYIHPHTYTYIHTHALAHAHTRMHAHKHTHTHTHTHCSGLSEAPRRARWCLGSGFLRAVRPVMGASGVRVIGL